MNNCKTCGTEKVFAPGNKYKVCPKCRRDGLKAHYESNKTTILSKTKLRKRLNYIVNRFKVIKYLLDHPCVDCGESNPILLEFDHLRDKSFAVKMKLRTCSWSTLIAEIAKCEVRCVSCHRLRTAEQHKQYQWVFDPEIIAALASEPSLQPTIDDFIGKANLKQEDVNNGTE